MNYSELFDSFLVGFHEVPGEDCKKRFDKIIEGIKSDGIHIDFAPGAQLASLTAVKPEAIEKYGDREIVKTFAKFMGYKGVALIRVPKVAMGNFHSGEKDSGRSPLAYLELSPEKEIKVPKECIFAMWCPEVYGNDKVYKNPSFDPQMNRQRNKQVKAVVGDDQIKIFKNEYYKGYELSLNGLMTFSKWQTLDRFVNYREYIFDKYYRDPECCNGVSGKVSMPEEPDFNELFDLHTYEDMKWDYSFEDILSTIKTFKPSTTTDYEMEIPGLNHVLYASKKDPFFRGSYDYHRIIKGADNQKESTNVNIRNICVDNDYTRMVCYHYPISLKSIIGHKFEKLCKLCRVPESKVNELWTKLMDEAVYEKEAYNKPGVTRNYYDLRKMLSIAKSVCGEAGELVVEGLLNVNGNTKEVSKAFDRNLNQATSLTLGGYKLDPEWLEYRKEQEKY